MDKRSRKDKFELQGGSTELIPPNDLGDLLRPLRGDLKPGEQEVKSIPYVHLQGEFLSEFDNSSPNSDRSAIRLKVLKTLGSCKTLKEFNFNFVLHSWKLSAYEWETLLKPLEPNEHIDKIGCSTKDKQMSQYIQRLVAHSHRLENLELVFCSSEGIAAAASGLGANSYHKLKNLSVLCEGSTDQITDVGIRTAEVLLCSRELEKFRWGFRSGCRMTWGAKEAMTKALIYCCSLKYVTIRYSPTEKRQPDHVMEEILTDAFDDRREPLQKLTILNYDKITPQALVTLVSSKISQIALYPVTSTDLGRLQAVGESLNRAPVLRELGINLGCFSGDMDNLSETLGLSLAELWEASKHSSNLIIDFVLEFKDIKQKQEAMYRILLENALSNTYLKSIRISVENITSAFECLVSQLPSNRSIQRLTITDSVEGSWKLVFNALRENTSIRVLHLQDTERNLTDDDFRDFVELLQMNFILEEVDLTDTLWRFDGRELSYMKCCGGTRSKLDICLHLLLQASSSMEPDLGVCSCAGRHLQAWSIAGKTRMKATMLETVGRKSTSESLVLKLHQKINGLTEKQTTLRTKGIEVELLFDEPHMTISVWDLAGQEIFQALQNILFPRINQSLIFVFVFNPFQSQSKSLRGNLYDEFNLELKSWLRFVVSSTQVRGWLKPRILWLSLTEIN